MKFKEIPYYRLNFKEFEKDYKNKVENFKAAESFQEAYFNLIEIDHLQTVFTSYAIISEAGNTGDTRNKFFQEEEIFFNEVKPLFALLIQEKNMAMLESPFRKKLEELMGQEFFNRLELSSQTMDKKIENLMKEENEFSQEFSNTISQIEVIDSGKRLSVSEASKLGNSKDREIRKKYNILVETVMKKNGPKFDYLFDEMMKRRNKIAHKMNFESYTDFCYCLRGRTGYKRKEINNFTKEVEDKLVPLVNQIYKNQAKKMNLEKIYVYDENFEPNKDVEIKENPLKAFKKIFTKLSPETKVFYDELLAKESYDLDLRPGKINGGYSNYLGFYSFPYIFETYNSTQGAVRTFAHECGHGLNSFLHRGEPLKDAVDASSDVCETHSMSMEFFVWPYLGEIVKEETLDNYKYNHLKNAISFIPYGTAINEFQTIVYDNPDYSCEKRREVWKELEKRFLPWRNYEKDLFSDEGRIWQRQMHVMKWPFYYIDYVLAQTVALQFWMLDENDHELAWNTYLEFIHNSGKYSFTETVEKAGLKSPFEVGFIEDLQKSIKKRMENYE